MNFDELPHLQDYYVTFNRETMDLGFIVREIKGSYWGSWRDPLTIFTSLENSICAGVFFRKGDGSKDEQVGFGRIVTDRATFVWICDIIITKDHRKKGLGKFLMGQIMAHPEVAPRACLLSTQDAQGLYKKFGFESFTTMKRVPDTRRGE